MRLPTVVGIFAIFLLSVTVTSAQTVINAVTDAASFAPRVAPGALATIFGSNLADSTAQASGFPLPRSLAGATVYVNNSPVPLLYASQTQINFQVPGSLAPGAAHVYVTRGGGNSLPFIFTVTSSAPEIFQDTSNHAIAQNASAGYTLNSSTNPADQGSVIVVYMNGPGPVDNPVPDGSPTPDAPLAKSTGSWAATIAGVSANVQFIGLTPGFAGLAQANIQVPTIPYGAGDYPLVITVGGYLSASAVLSVSGSGSTPPAFLKQAGRVNFGNDLSSTVAVYNNTTYVCGANRIRIIDTSNVNSPQYIGEFGDSDLNGNGGICRLNTDTTLPILVDIVGPGDSQSLAVYNLSTPTAPVKMVQQPTGSSPDTFLTNIGFIGATGFASTSWFTYDGSKNITAQHGDILAYDITLSFPLPTLISAVAPDSTFSNLNLRPNLLAVAPSGNYPNTVYVASTTATGTSTTGNAALDVINVSNVQSMQPVTRVTVADSTIFFGIAYDHQLLLVTGNTTGYRNPGNPDFSVTGNLTLTTMNIDNVESPFQIKTVQTSIATTGTYAVQPLGSSIFAIVNNPPSTDVSGPGNLMIVDASDANSPVLYPFQAQFGFSGIAAAGNLTYLLVPDVNGLTIYQIQLPSS